MGVLQRWERRLESLVNRPFAKAFKAEVQPVELAAALQRECDDRAAVVSRARTMVPNAFVVELADHDYERLSPYAEPLGTELSAMVQEHAAEQQYSFLGPVGVTFERHDDLDTGMFRVRSQVQAGDPRRAAGDGTRGQSPAPAAPAPAGATARFDAVGPSVPEAEPPAPAAPPAPRPRWTVEVAGTAVELTGTTTVVGRGTDADLRIDDPGVSRRHAQLVLRGEDLVVADLGSTNGVVVDGRRVDRATLADGASVRLGSTTVVVRRREA